MMCGFSPPPMPDANGANNGTFSPPPMPELKTASSLFTSAALTKLNPTNAIDITIKAIITFFIVILQFFNYIFLKDYL